MLKLREFGVISMWHHLADKFAYSYHLSVRHCMGYHREKLHVHHQRVRGIRHSKVIRTAIQHLTTHKLPSRELTMSSTIYVLIIIFPIYLTQNFKDNIFRVTLHTDRPKIISRDFSPPCSIWPGILLDIFSVLYSSYVQIISYIVCLRGNSQFS